jgi:MFS family permease/tetratricopeptide (TPR) repeat protein
LTALSGLVPGLSSRAWLVLGGDALSAVGSGLTLPFLLVYLHRVRGVELGVAGLILATVAAAGLVGNPAGGWLADRFGARRAVIVGLLLAAVGTAAIAIVHSAWQGFAAAGLYGLGMALLWPAEDALLATAVIAEQRPRVFAVRHATLNTGFSVGALLAALVVGFASPASFALVYLLDATSFLVFAVIVARLADVVPAQTDTGTAAKPGSYSDVVADPLFRRLWLLVLLLVTAGYAQYHAAFPAYATGVGGLSAPGLGLTFTANTVTVVVAQLTVLRLLAGRRRTRAVILSAGFVAAAWLATLMAGGTGGQTTGLVLFIAAMVLFALGETLLSPTVPAMVNDLAPERLRGRYNGAYSLAWTVGYIIGPALAGFALAAGRQHALFTGLISALSVAGLVAWRLERRLPPVINRVGPGPRAATDGLGPRSAKISVETAESLATGVPPRPTSGTPETLSGALTPLRIATGEALLEEALAARSARAFDDARRAARQALAAMHDTGGLRSAPMARALLLIGRIEQDLGRTDAAEQAFQQASSIVATTGTEEFGDAAVLGLHADLELADLWRIQGRYPDAEAIGKSTLRRAETALGPDAIEVATACNALAIIYKYTGHFADAQALYQRALAITENLFGPDHPNVASIHHNLGGLAHARGAFHQAEAPARRAIEIREQALSPDHVDVAADKAALAAIVDALGRHDEAERLLRDALAVFERVLGPRHKEVAVNLHNLGAIHQRRGDLASAQALYRRALAIKEDVLGPTHPELATTLNNLGLVREAQGHHAEALALFSRAVTTLEHIVEPDHPTLVISRAHQAILSRGTARSEGVRDHTGRRPGRIWTRICRLPPPWIRLAANRLRACWQSRAERGPYAIPSRQAYTSWRCRSTESDGGAARAERIPCDAPDDREISIVRSHNREKYDENQQQEGDPLGRVRPSIRRYARCRWMLFADRARIVARSEGDGGGRPL